MTACKLICIDLFSAPLLAAVISDFIIIGLSCNRAAGTNSDNESPLIKEDATNPEQ
jgi:hypothetical protein